MIFIDPHKPIATCVAETCDNCPAQKALHCHFSLKDLVHFYSIAAPTFLLGGAGIYHISGWWLIPWLIIIIAYFGFIEIRVMCSHCPHYAEKGSTLQCWANYGSPKIWSYRPGPMKVWEKVVFLMGFALIWGFPLFFLILGKQLFLLVVYLLTVTGFFMTVRMFLCSQCFNFACPLNAVKDEVRTAFFERNSEIAKAWLRDI
ncbi:hypothetical protein ACFL27_19225 [candidate division CSSED10-310 bacterium]|uniref:4Fe-4S binding protein n=1 Tax=candidate division CSSED10-310 bacterium TaxID=2855610 RepID=A0ABV6Z1L3_UNCC1